MAQGGVPKLQAEVSLNAQPFKEGADQVKASGRDLANELKRSGAEGAKALDGIPEAGERAAQKLDAATKSIATSIRRATTETQKAASELVAESGSVGAFEKRIQLAGANAEALRPLIQGLSEARDQYSLLAAAQREAADSISFEKQHQEAKRLATDGEYVRFWVRALEEKEAAEREASSALSFEKQHQEARRLVTDAEYVKFWTDSLQRKDIAEREASDNLLFEQQHQSARKLAADAEYVRFWTDALEEKERVEKRQATQNAFVDSLRNQAEAIGKSRADLLAMQATKLGVQKEAAPFIEALRREEQAFDRLGMTAKQTRAALAQVPAQFTDIVTSLASGSPPLTVFIQQGGQLKDTFGGVGAAASALGNYVLGLINPFTVLAAAFGAIAYGFISGRSESQEFAKALILTGNAAGTTAGGLSDMAASVERLAGGTQTRAAEVLTQLANSASVGAVNMERFAAAAIGLERAGGPAAEQTIKSLAELAKAPLEASLKLNEAQNYLTQSTYEQIKALEEQGRKTDAARVAQEAYASAVELRTPQIVNQLGYIDRAWLAIKDSAKEALDTLRDIGRPSTSVDRLQSLTAQLRANRLAGRGEASIPGLGSQNDGLREAIRLESRRLLLQAEVTAAEAARTESVKAAADWDKQGAKFTSDRVKMEREIAAARETGIAAGKSQEEIESRIASIRASYQKDSASGRAEVSQYTREMIAQGEAVEQWRKQWEAARRESEKAMAAAIREREQYLTALDRQMASAGGDTQRLEDELLAITQGKEALEERIQARLIDQAVALEARAQWAAADEEEAARLVEIARQLRRQAELRRQVASATDEKEVNAANARAAQQAEAEWQRTADQIEQALVNALMEGGKSGAELIKGVFRTLVLKPTIEAIVRPFARDIAGVARAFLGLDGGTSDPEMAKLRRQAGLSERPSMWTEFSQWSAQGFERAGDKLAERGFKDIGSFLKDNNQTLGKVSQTLGEVGNYFQAFKAAEDGRWGEAIGQAVGTAIGGPMGGQIGQQIGSFVDRIFRGGAGTPHRGSIVRTMADGTQSLARDADWASILNNYDQGTDQGLRTLAGIATGGFNRFASAFGQQGTAQSVISFAADGRDASIGNFQLTRDGRSLVNLGGTDFARYSSDGAQAFQAFGLDVLRQTRAALDTLDLSQWARDELKKFDDQIATLGEGNLERATDLFNNTVEGIARLQTGMVELQKFLEPLGGVFLKVSDLSGDAMKELVDFAGGLENLANQTQSYVQNFFGREEIAGLQAREVRDTLLGAGLTERQLRGLDTREEFRALVESIDPSTEAGAKQFAALLGVAQTFAGLSDYFASDGGDLLSASNLAPNTGQFTAPGAAPTAQAAESPAVAVLTNINAGIDKVVSTLRELIDINRTTPRVAVSVPGGSEVTMDWQAGS